MEDHRRIADRLAGEITTGRLRPGERLPPQRDFARRHGIAASTAARVYRELVRRGLVVGEVGRGTFVRAAGPRPVTALEEPPTERVDLEFNFPVLPDQAELLGQRLGRLLRPDALAQALRPVGVHGTPAAREAAAGLLAQGGWAPDPASLIFPGNGRQAIASAIAALVPAGQRLGVESLTYPVVKAIAARLGVTLVPVPVDEAGLIPEALRAVHRATPLRALYFQPTLHNPLGGTMPEPRRAALAEALTELDLPALEDCVYGFLGPRLTPVAALAPRHVVLVESLSKRVAPGLTLGFLAPPVELVQRLAAATRSGGWGAPGFALDAATGLIADGTVAAISQAKRRDAATRQEIVRERLAGFSIRADPGSYHCWWQLPEPWRAETFVAAAARRGLAVTPAAAFTVGPGHAPNAVRLGIASPPVEVLASALDQLRTLAGTGPEEHNVE